MKIIVDTNIIFSSLLTKDNDSKYFLTSTDHEIYSCHYLFIEIFKHKDKIIKISKLSEDDILLQMDKVFSRINFVQDSIIPISFYTQAFKICKNIDENDTPFIALSLFLDGYFLTGDKNIYSQLKNCKLKVLNLQEALQ